MCGGVGGWNERDGIWIDHNVGCKFASFFFVAFCLHHLVGRFLGVPSRGSLPRACGVAPAAMGMWRAGAGAVVAQP